jgi:hypothetical protein
MHPKDLREESQELFTQPCPQKQDSQKPEKLETTQASTTMGKQLHKVGTVHTDSLTMDPKHLEKITSVLNLY